MGDAVEPTEHSGHPVEDVTHQRAVRDIVVALPLKAAALRAVQESLGPGFRVRDLHLDGPPPEIVLAPPASPQLIGRLKATYPGASLIVVELEDWVHSISIKGPVARSVAAGADLYFLAPSTQALGAFLQALPERGAERELVDGPEVVVHQLHEGPRPPGAPT